MPVWCPACRTGYGTSGRLPPGCPCCQRPLSDREWLRSDPTPRVPWQITRDDWHFLKARQIDPERERPEP